MRLDAGILSLAPSDLSRHLGCAHATRLALEAARGEHAGPTRGGAYERLIFEKGDAHERAYRDQLVARGIEVTEIEQSGSYADMAARTRSAMEAGAAVIYQATFELAAGEATPTSSSGSSFRPASANSATRPWTPSSRATRRGPRTSCNCASTARASGRAGGPSRAHAHRARLRSPRVACGRAISTRTSRARSARSSASSMRRRHGRRSVRGLRDVRVPRRLRRGVARPGRPLIRRRDPARADRGA